MLSAHDFQKPEKKVKEAPVNKVKKATTTENENEFVDLEAGGVVAAAIADGEETTDQDYYSAQSTTDINSEEERQALIRRIRYSDRYQDGQFEYRHVIVPQELYVRYVGSEFRNRLLSEDEWRAIGIRQSPGWVHYELHGPEPHIFLFRRALTN